MEVSIKLKKKYRISKAYFEKLIYRFQSHLYNTQFGLIMSEAEWEDEWKSVLKLASSEPRNTVVESQRRRSRMSIIGSIKDLDSQGESSSASSTASTGNLTYNFPKVAIFFFWSYNSIGCKLVSIQKLCAKKKFKIAIFKNYLGHSNTKNQNQDKT